MNPMVVDKTCIVTCEVWRDTTTPCCQKWLHRRSEVVTKAQRLQGSQGQCETRPFYLLLSYQRVNIFVILSISGHNSDHNLMLQHLMGNHWSRSLAGPLCFSRMTILSQLGWSLGVDCPTLYIILAVSGR